MKPAVDGVLGVWDDLVENFSVAAMIQSESGKLNKKVIEEVGHVLKQGWLFPALAEMFAMFAAIIDKYSSRLEGCHCHEAIWRQKRKFATRLRQVAQSTGHNHCVW